jgi:N-acetylmuramic acid 6-phosphate etherase
MSAERSRPSSPDPEAVPLTERANPRTGDLDRLELPVLLERILAEDALVPGAVHQSLPDLERAVRLLHRTLAEGGRWINLGAGTSGRLGLLDAAELPPTFGIDPEQVQAVVAGGEGALARAVEGAEDDGDAAERELSARGIGRSDAVVGISASGRTPFVLAGIDCARRRGARTLAITCAGDAPLAARVELPIVVEVGPEVIAGSTRMKGALAQKIVLHTLSTAVMVRLGRVRGNRMTALRAQNSKLRERALRTLMELAGVARADAERALDQAGGSLADALDRLR